MRREKKLKKKNKSKRGGSIFPVAICTKKQENTEKLKKHLKALNRKMKESASNLEFEEAAKIRDEIRKLEASELEISLNPKISQYNLKSKVYPKGRSTMGMPGTKPRKAIKKWKPKK